MIHFAAFLLAKAHPVGSLIVGGAAYGYAAQQGHRTATDAAAGTSSDLYSPSVEDILSGRALAAKRAGERAEVMRADRARLIREQASDRQAELLRTAPPAPAPGYTVQGYGDRNSVRYRVLDPDDRNVGSFGSMVSAIRYTHEHAAKKKPPRTSNGYRG